MCVREREYVCVCERESMCERERKREREYACVCGRERERSTRDESHEETVEGLEEDAGPRTFCEIIVVGTCIIL